MEFLPHLHQADKHCEQKSFFQNNFEERGVGIIFIAMKLKLEKIGLFEESEFVFIN